MKTIRNDDGIFVELSKDQLKFESKEAEIIFDLSLENDFLQQENQDYLDTEDEFYLLGYTFGNLSTRNFINDKVEILEEDKDIEELKIENDNPTHFYIRDEKGTKCGMTKHSKMIAEKLNEVIREVNKLRSKEQ